MVMVFGEITTGAKVNYEEIVRKTCKEIGFISEDVGLDADNCKVCVPAHMFPIAAIAGNHYLYVQLQQKQHTRYYTCSKVCCRNYRSAFCRVFFHSYIQQQLQRLLGS